ncbi:MAG TPA: guanylate kinase [Vicinamibacteria bacterium]|nr:guanylate kinase [Vicinamibacteria bacterium]
MISAPSGSGKTTLVRKLIASFSDLRFSVSYTTRAPRGAERDGVDYHFVTRGEFQEKIRSEEFLEWAEVHGNLYGTSKPETERIRAEGQDILLDVDVQGADQVRKAEPEAVTMFVMPPSFEVLEERLRGRKQDSPEVIEGRLAGARREIDRYRDYHYVLVNDGIEETAELLKAIVLAERARPHLLEERLRPILETFRS